MKFKDLVAKHKWADIEKRFRKLYPDQKKNLPGYKAVLEKKLPKIKPEKSDFRIVVHTVKKDKKWNDHEYVSVSGGNEAECDTNYMAIEFTPWAKWLGSYIDVGSTFEFTEMDILIHCLWEMTYMGWDQGPIQKKVKGMKKMMDNIIKDPKKYTTPYNPEELGIKLKVKTKK